MTTNNKSSANQLKILYFYQSAVGKKVIMAITGLAILGFVIAHLLGNLQIFLGQEKFNQYAHFLKSIPGPLWTARIVLLIALVLHVLTGFHLRILNKKARPVAYAKMNDIQLSSASKYMLETGVVILAFIGLHLAHFTFAIVQPDHSGFEDDHGMHDVYKMVILGFQNGPYAILYILAMFALGVHLRHAFWSVFQSVGLYSPAIGACLKKVSLILAVIVSLAYISIPLSVKFGLLN